MFDSSKLSAYIALTRLNRPIGIYLLLWPTLWALWIAADGFPPVDILLVFIAGTVLMRSAGCAINDFADRKVDGMVSRTKDRPLACGHLQAKDAIISAVFLSLLAFLLVLLLNRQTILLSLGAVFLAAIYPFMKRYTYLPQVFLGMAFAWATPMAFSALNAPLDRICWLLYLATVVWAVAYDTLYAMADKPDDLKAGIKSTAILFGEHDLKMVMFFHLLTLLILFLVGRQLEMSFWYYLGLAGAAISVDHQLWLAKKATADKYIAAFLHNHYFGMSVFAGIFLHYLLQ